LRAASALDRETAREEQKASSDVVRKIVEDSEECLIVIDREGKILEASGPAAQILFAPWGRVEGTFREELFFVEARDAVMEWRKRLDSPALAPAQMKKRVRPVALEAALIRGGLIGLQGRRKVSGIRSGGPRWLIQFEDEEAQHTLRPSEERLAERATAMVQFPKDELSGDFGEVLRHEVNNPLTGIPGNTELLLARRDRLPPSNGWRPSRGWLYVCVKPFTASPMPAMSITSPQATFE
jgi:signal transduction histidine kinase